MSSPRFAVILPAAGRSVRFGTDKLAQPLVGIPILQRSIDAFLPRADVAQIILPTSDIDHARSLLSDAILNDPKLLVCHGGACRAESVRAGLTHVRQDVEWVAVHDAARPLVSQALIDRTFAAAVEYGAAVPAMAVQLTVKQAAGPLPAKVVRTIPRHELWAMQTPQVMRRDDLKTAYEMCPLPLEQVTDDMQLIELARKPVWLVAGEERNLKVTTPMDLAIAEQLLASR